MIRDKKVAKEIADTIENCLDLINKSILLVQAKCDKDEFEGYRKAAGMVMGYMYTDILAPLYKDHPELDPEGNEQS